MKEGIYLLHLPGKDYVTPVTLKNGDGGDIIGSAQYVQVVANLPEGTELVPMLAMGPIVLDALKVLVHEFDYPYLDRLQAHRIISDILKEYHP
jgi:hypothetical protein